MTKNNIQVYSLFVVALLFAGLSFFLQVLPVNTADHFTHTLGLTTANVIELASLYLLAYAIMQIPIGIVFDKYGVKWVLPMGLIFTGLGSLLYLIGSNSAFIAIGRALTGIGCSVGYISGIFIAVKYFSPKRLAICVSLVEGISTLGAMVATTTFNELLTSFGWNIANTMIVIFCIILLVFSLFFGRGLDYSTSGEIKHKSFKLAIFQALSLMKDKRLLAIFIYSFCTWLIIMSFAGYWLKYYMITMHKYEVNMALKLASFYWMAFFIANVTIGFFVQELKGCKIAMLILAIISFVNYCYMAVPILFSYEQLAIVSILGGITTSGVIMAFAIIPKFVSEEMSGTALAVNNTFIIIGGYIGQILFGKIIDNVNILKCNCFLEARNIDPTYYSAILIYPFFALIGLLAVIYAVRKIK